MIYIQSITFINDHYSTIFPKMEAEILIEIRDAEKKAEEIIERAKRQKEAVLHEAVINSSKLLAEKKEEIKKFQEKKISEARDKSKLLKEEKLKEASTAVKQLKAKTGKNIGKSVDFVVNKFEEMI